MQRVTNAQRLAVALNNVRDVAGNISNAVSGTMNVLIGDTNADRFVNSADISQTNSQWGASVSGSNFGDAFLNSADISLVKSKSATALP